MSTTKMDKKEMKVAGGGAEIEADNKNDAINKSNKRTNC